jgi:hypothetical protein
MFWMVKRGVLFDVWSEFLFVYCLDELRLERVKLDLVCIYVSIFCTLLSFIYFSPCITLSFKIPYAIR